MEKSEERRNLVLQKSKQSTPSCKQTVSRRSTNSTIPIKCVKSRIKLTKAVFHLQDKNADDEVLTKGLIKSAKRSGQLTLSGKGLGTVPEKVWKLDELVLEESKDVDFNRSDSASWWNTENLKVLDLSSNAINQISPNIKLLQELNTLRFHDNALTELPAEFGELKDLANLSLDRNKLTILPQEFYKLTELRWLSLSYNMIKEIQPSFGDLVMLKFLDLSNNKLKSLPPGMGYLVRLLELNLSYNLLEELPPDIVNLRDLKKWNVSYNSLKALPALGELRKMEYFNANNNKICELPSFLGCTALYEIHIANNQIKEISEEFCEEMQLLKVFNIRDNQLEKIPENITLLKCLTRFDVTNNNLNKLPSNLGLMTQLQALSVEGNRLSFVRHEVLRAGTDRVMKFLRDMVVDEMAVDAACTKEDWPDKFTLKKTQGLIIPSRNLTEVPDDVFKAAAAAEVYIVDLSKNKLANVPLSVCCLSDTLSQLVLNTNSLTAFPAQICECKHLQYLDISKNQIEDLPLELGTLKKLREIIISSNRFTKIPRCVYEMDELEILLAANNKISEINISSDALPRLKRLAVLDLTNNNIPSVPPELGNFTQLRSLELSGNMFRQPRQAILSKGTESILSYLRDRIASH